MGTGGATLGSTAAETALADSSSGDGPEFEVGINADAPEGSGTCGFTDWSYVFIANSDEATLSKMNTRTLVGEGRYHMRPSPRIGRRGASDARHRHAGH